MSSLLELACGRGSVVDPDKDSKIDTEARRREGDWQRGGGGVRMGPRDERGGGQAMGGELGGVMIETRVGTSGISARGSVWMETEA